MKWLILLRTIFSGGLIHIWCSCNSSTVYVCLTSRLNCHCNSSAIISQTHLHHTFTKVFTVTGSKPDVQHIRDKPQESCAGKWDMRVDRRMCWFWSKREREVDMEDRDGGSCEMRHDYRVPPHIVLCIRRTNIRWNPET